ncbi:hypothetical protein, partial [Pseudomonas sp. 2995-3]|uniref:hypothetical protein n=1 Tax=Pseudomonas sp. 2995-3 TaxID=1712680 RepID=UPI001C447B49
NRDAKAKKSSWTLIEEKTSQRSIWVKIRLRLFNPLLIGPTLALLVLLIIPFEFQWNTAEENIQADKSNTNRITEDEAD